MAGQAYITVKIDIGEAARRVLQIEIHNRRQELQAIQSAVNDAVQSLERFAYSCGVLGEVELVSGPEETAVQG
jgi:hypothetical protein